MRNRMRELLAVTLFVLVVVAGCGPAAPASQPPAAQPAPVPSKPAPTIPIPEPAPPPTPAPAPPTPAPPPPAPAIPEGINIGNRALDFKLPTLAGDNVSLSGLRGKFVLLNFWATWCGPCKFEMPFLQQVHDTWNSKGLVVLEIDVGEKSDTIQKFMTELNLSTIVPMDTDMKVAKAYSITAIPTTFIIDKDGIIRQKVIGAFPNKEAIERELGKIIP